MVEADPRWIHELSAVAAERPGWGVRCALLGDEDRPDARYHVMSNPAASGPTDVEGLRALWPNLRCVATRTMSEHRLESLLDAAGPGAFPAPNWIVVDCLTAVPILRGMGRYLNKLDVVWAQVVRDTTTLNLPESSLQALTELLLPFGFRLVEVVEAVNPVLGEAIYLRDWRAWLEPHLQWVEDEKRQWEQRCEAQARLAADCRRQAETLREARDAEAERATQLEETLGRQQAELSQLRDRLEEQRRAAAELDAQLSLLAPLSAPGTHGSPSKRMDERRRYALTQSPMALGIEIEGEAAEWQLRQRRMDEELIRAEAQIDLLKDILLGGTRR